MPCCVSVERWTARTQAARSVCIYLLNLSADLMTMIAETPAVTINTNVALKHPVPNPLSTLWQLKSNLAKTNSTRLMRCNNEHSQVH